MPELPEVEAMRRMVEEHCVGRRIRRVVAREAGGGPRDGKFDDKVIGEGVTEQSLADALAGREIAAAKRLGKHLWLELGGSGPHLLLHCGMTGSLAMDGVERFSFQSFSIDEEWPPRFTKLQLDLSGRRGPKGPAPSTLAFVDARRFGKILLRQAPAQEPPVSLLAADPVASPPSLEAFAEALRRASAPVKSVLLDQGRVVCGIGNWIADEVLHKARVHPAAPANTLSDKQVAAVHAAVLAVVSAAVAVDADAARFPKGWLFHFRWGVGTASGSVVQLPSGDELKFEEVGGRTTAFVPSLQRMGERPVEKDLATPKRRAGGGLAVAGEGESPKVSKRRRPKSDVEAKATGDAKQGGEAKGAAGRAGEGPGSGAGAAAPRKRPAAASRGAVGVGAASPGRKRAAAQATRFAVPLRGSASLDLA